jgi:hypothetical protein
MLINVGTVWWKDQKDIHETFSENDILYITSNKTILTVFKHIMAWYIYYPRQKMSSYKKDDIWT